MKRLMQSVNMFSRCISVCAFLAACTATALTVDTTQVPPLMTGWAIRGLPQVASAESQGAGRLSICVTGAWYQQKTGFPNAPNTGANIGTGTLGFSFAASNYIEIFGTIAGFGGSNYQSANNSGIGTISAGVLGMLPLPEQAPFRLGAQAVVVGGTSSNQINKNYADGYNYFDTRTGYDFMGRAIEAFVLGDEYVGFRLLLNEAFATSVQESHANLMMLAGGVQGILARYYVVGLEINSRTYLNNVQIQTDPLWLTPSLTFRTPYFTSLTLGSDISLSSDRTGDPAVRALEQYRLFGGLSFSVDALAHKRRVAAEEEQRRIAEKAALEQKTRQLTGETDSLTRIARKAHQDSIAQARQADSLATVARALAQKATADSLALIDSNRKLDEERSKRSDVEKKLLSTGMLILDAVYFESGKAEISINSKPYLNIIAKMLAKYPKLMLEVGGHTDNVGGYTMNQRLSQLRAESVRLYLINVEPSLSNRLTAMGYGPSVPKAENRTAEGRKINRRTELTVVNKDALKEYNP
jgi:outer membrane protein OmpA-like peptidoglycan-associated protein